MMIAVIPPPAIVRANALLTANAGILFVVCSGIKVKTKRRDRVTGAERRGRSNKKVHSPYHNLCSKFPYRFTNAIIRGAYKSTGAMDFMTPGISSFWRSLK